MTLFARLKKGKFNDPATAISAISAIALRTEGSQGNACVRNSKIAPIAVATANRQNAEQQTIALLARFQLHDCEHDPEPAMISRINNICFRLVQVNGWEFGEAMTAAAQWVAHHPQHRDEACFTDVMQLYRHLSQVGHAPAPGIDDSDKNIPF